MYVRTHITVMLDDNMSVEVRVDLQEPEELLLSIRDKAGAVEACAYMDSTEMREVAEMFSEALRRIDEHFAAEAAETAEPDTAAEEDSS